LTNPGKPLKIMVPKSGTWRTLLSAHIRLQKIGKRKRPYYRIVVLDSRAPRDGAYLECLGYYQPIEKDTPMKINMDKYQDWIKKGAKASNVVRDIAKKLIKAK
jgi:small subunit ribosomal protein S16